MTPGKKLGALSRKHLLEVKRHQLHLKPKFIHLKGCYKICKNKYLLLFGIYTKSTHRSWFTVIYSVSSSVKDKHLTVTIPEYSLYQARAALSLFLHLQRIPQNLLLDGRWRNSWIASGTRGTSGLTTTVASLQPIHQPSSPIRSQSGTQPWTPALWPARTNCPPPSSLSLPTHHQVQNIPVWSKWCKVSYCYWVISAGFYFTFTFRLFFLFCFPGPWVTKCKYLLVNNHFVFFSSSIEDDRAVSCSRYSTSCTTIWRRTKEKGTRWFPLIWYRAGMVFAQCTCKYRQKQYVLPFTCLYCTVLDHIARTCGMLLCPFSFHHIKWQRIKL